MKSGDETMWPRPLIAPHLIPPLALAYIGDAVFELYVRLRLLEQGKTKVNQLHQEASALVKASSQSGFLHRLETVLSPEEWEVAKRGRNTKGTHVPKNAEVTDYRWSTGFEALLGYLFLQGHKERIQELLEVILQET